MITRSGSWSAPGLELRRTAAAAALGAVLFLASWGLLHVHPFDRRHHQIIDTPVYQLYGDAILEGRVPYRDFSLEYPPAALPVFALPSLAPGKHYRTAFEALMLLCGLGVVALVAVTLSSIGASSERLFVACVLVGLAPLLFGTVVLTRFDLWPALLAAGALAALVADRDRLGLGLLALAACAKGYPVVLAPIFLVFVGRRKGAREAGIALAVFLGTAAIVLLPFAILSPDGLVDSFRRQIGRPLQIESLGSGLLLAVHQVGSYEPTIVSSSGSQNLAGGLPDALASFTTALQLVALLGVWLLFATRRGWPEELLAASAAAACTFVALGKVLSPQYLIWLIPLVALVGGMPGAVAWALLVAALVLTQLWFPERYWHLVALDTGPTWLLVARDVVLVALAATLAVATARERGRSRSS